MLSAHTPSHDLTLIAATDRNFVRIEAGFELNIS